MKKSLINNCFDIAINRMTGYSSGYSFEDCCTLYTDAFWKLQYEVYDELYGRELKVEKTVDYVEEIIACMLGGFGFKAEIGWSAYLKLKNLGLIKRGVGYFPLEDALSQPLKVGDRWIRYRFPHQKAKYVYDFLRRDDIDSAPIKNDLDFRSWLMTIKGIGPKTASWITRNYFRSDNVAVIDIHLYRAGILTGFVSPQLNVQKDYFEIERCYLEYCHSLMVKPSVMDIVMWTNMKKTNKIAISLIKNY